MADGICDVFDLNRSHFERSFVLVLQQEKKILLRFRASENISELNNQQVSIKKTNNLKTNECLVKQALTIVYLVSENSASITSSPPLPPPGGLPPAPSLVESVASAPDC